ncbi:uncharacterized protein LOC115326947 [Ixodes scapularis]|uniref:uncharacterized protein LOC115326947 n=1 Tax=Ixodes scapularis TaxID=6945 RepID=UPI001A9D75AD|nr:uncharacterized protein LOC115326947 [Ixodes scapularis]
MPRLSEKHFNLTFASKMSVKLAAQIFSNHCAAAMFAMVTFQQLPVEAIHTARFIEKMDRLFDSLNSSQKRGKSAYVSAMHEGSVHKEFLKECLHMFESLTVLGCPRQPACIRGFSLTIRSIMLICEHLTSEYGFRYLLTRHLNQDALENTFSVIRSKSGANANSSCRQFQAAFRHLLVSNLFKLSDKSNCEEDMATLLAALPVGFSAPSASLSLGSSLPQCAADLTSCSYPILLSLNNMVYFAGWLVTRFIKYHTCHNVTQQCELQIKNATFSDDSQVFLYLSVKGTAEGDFGSLSVPSPCFVSSVQACEKVFVASIDSLVLKEGVGKALCITLHEKVEKLLTLCSEDVYGDLFALFTRVRLHWFVRKKNTELFDAAVRRKTQQRV